VLNISANFRKIRNDSNVIFRRLREGDSRKKSEAINFVTLVLFNTCDNPEKQASIIVKNNFFLKYILVSSQIVLKEATGFTVPEVLRRNGCLRNNYNFGF
jgi:hypothetical protein